MRQKKIFTSGMNSDYSLENLKDGQDRYRQNVRVLSVEKGNSGILETMNGNTFIPYSLPMGNNKVIGTKEDLKTAKIYYFVYNDTANHSILQFDTNTNQIVKVFQDAILNFQIDFLITGISVVELNEDNHLLYWTDNWVDPNDPNIYNEPRKLNIEKAIAYSAGDYVNGYKSPFNPLWMYRIKQPPLFPPTYTWSGIGSITPVTKFTATSTIPVVIGIHSEQTVAFNVDPFAPGDGYDTTTYQWTSTVNAVTNITTTNTFDLPANGTFIVELWINGVYSSVNGQYYGPYSGSPTTITITTVFPNILLNIGDVIEIVAHNSSSVSTMTVRDGSFSLQAIPNTSSVDVNHLYKKLFQFKVKYVFDDYEESAWSPISRFVMPLTTNGGVTGEDIAKQDNVITITIPTGSSIVTRIKIAARNVDQINFSQIADINKAELEILDDTTYNYIFTDFGGAIPIDVNDSIKLFDSIPLYSQGLEFIDGNKIADANITEDQNPVDIDMRLVNTFELIDVNPNSWFPKYSYLKSGGKYQFGIVYYDQPGNRSGLVNSTIGPFNVQNDFGKFGNQLYVPFLTDSNYDAPHGTPNLDMSYVPIPYVFIYNNAPSWATHYQIVRSKNQSMGRYIQFAVDHFAFNDYGPTASPIKQSVKIFLQNIAVQFNTENPSSHLFYDFIPGDRIRFIANPIYATGLTGIANEISDFYPYIDVPVSSFDSGALAITIAVTVDVPGPSSVVPGTLVEIYQPNNVIDESTELIYEIGECYPIITDGNGNKLHGGQINESISDFNVSILIGSIITISLPVGHGILVDQQVKVIGDNGFSSYGIVTNSLPTQLDIDTTGFTIIGSVSGPGKVIRAAQIKLIGGDSFRRLRNMPFNTIAGMARLYSYIEDSQVSDVFVSPADDIGRPNRIDDTIRRITRHADIRYSESFIPETSINGLSTMYPINIQSYNPAFGPIMKLYSNNQRLKIFQKLKCSSIPINQVIFNDYQGKLTVGASSVVLSPQTIYAEGEWGIGMHPESFYAYGDVEYFIDTKRGVILRWSRDGLTPISDTNFMGSFISGTCKEIEIFPGKINIYGVYDKRFNEYIISFETKIGFLPGPIPVAFVGKTLGFNEAENAFTSFYDYKPEFMCSNNVNIVSFKNGKFYTHNTNALQANFYGTQYYPEIWVAFNDKPSDEKVFLAIGEESSQVWELYKATDSDFGIISNYSGQKSTLRQANFEMNEGMQYASVLFDQNTPNIPDGKSALFEGDVLRDTVFLCKFTYPNSGYSVLRAINFEYIISDLHNR